MHRLTKNSGPLWRPLLYSAPQQRNICIARVRRAHVDHPRQSYNHLRNILASQDPTAGEIMAPNTSQSIEDGRKEEENGSRNQIRLIRKDAKPLYDAHNRVHESAHVVSDEAADEGLEFRRGLGS